MDMIYVLFIYRDSTRFVWFLPPENGVEQEPKHVAVCILLYSIVLLTFIYFLKIII